MTDGILLLLYGYYKGHSNYYYSTKAYQVTLISMVRPTFGQPIRILLLKIYISTNGVTCILEFPIPFTLY